MSHMPGWYQTAKASQFMAIGEFATNRAAQPPVNIEIGFRAGVPFTESLTSRLTGSAAFFSSTSFVKPGFTLGPTLGMIYHDQLEVEFDAIYTPIRIFGSSTLGPSLQSSSTTRGSSWRTLDSRTGLESVSSGSFRESAVNQGAALVINGGLEWRNSRLLIRPELRYTHRSDADQNTFPLRAPNQFEYLIGLSFLARSAGASK